MRWWRAGVVSALLLIASACSEEGPPGEPRPPAAGEDAPASAVSLGPGCRAGEVTRVRAERREVTVGDQTRAYWLDVPGGSASEARPLVMVFHALDGRPRRLRRWSGLGRMAHRMGFVAVFPEGHEGVELGERVGRGWDIHPHQSQDLTFVEGLLDELERTWCIDPNRIYVAGLSNGGLFANLLGCRMAERLAGVAAVAGSLPLRDCRPARPVPILLIHGKRDQVMEPAMARAARDWWRRVNECGGDGEQERHCTHYRSCRADVSYCEAGQGHWWPRPASRRIWSFFEAHPAAASE